MNKNGLKGIKQMKNDEMPDEIYLSRDGFGNVVCHYQDGHTKYTRADRPDPEMAEVREALKFYANAGPLDLAGDTTFEETDFGSVMTGGIRAKQALAILDRKIGGA